MSVSVCVCLSVCLSVHGHVLGTTRPIFTNFFLRVTYGRGSVLLRRRSDTLYISGFVDDVIFSHKLTSCSTRHRQAEAVRLTHTQPRAWRVGIPVAGSGRSDYFLQSVKAY